MADTIEIEVAYAQAERQFLRRITLETGATVADAIAASGLEAEFGIDISQLAAGIWSKPATRETLLTNGDRVELYRPLTADPKETRRRRAKRSGRQP